jgi:hypothetical protein
MKWDFTPEDVRSGKADYSVFEFKEALLKEIHANLESFQGDELTKKFYSFMTMMLCLFLATGKSIDSFVADIKQRSSSKEVHKFLIDDRKMLEEIGENNKENLAMLRAVIYRRLKDGVENGITPDNIRKNITTEFLAFFKLDS